MALKPINFADPMYQLLRDGNVKEFNRRKAAGEQCNLTNCDLRNLDLRGFDAAGLDLSDSYLRNANLRAIDFSTFRPRRNRSFRRAWDAPALQKVAVAFSYKLRRPS